MSDARSRPPRPPRSCWGPVGTRLAQIKSLARSGSLKSGRATEQSLERYRRATLGAASGVVARVVSLLTVFVSVPVVLAELGQQEFGIWATIASFTVLLNFSDLGVSNGLVNILVRADVDKDRLSAANHVTSALVVLTTVAAVLGVVFIAVYPLVDWRAVYNAGAAVDAEVPAHATAVFVGCFLALLPLGIFQKVHLGYQQGVLTWAWAAAGNILGFVGVVIAALADASLAWFVAGTVGGPVLASCLNGMVLLGRSRPWLRPRLSHLDRASIRRLLSTGGPFFVIQSSVAVASASGPIIVAQVEGAATVAEFAVPMRLFAFLPILFSIAMTAAWPTLRSAILEGDIEWARRGLKRATGVGLSLIAVPTCVLVAFGDSILRLWTSGEVGASTSLLALLGGWALLSAIVWPLWTTLVAADALRVQAVMSALMAVASVGLSVKLAQGIGVSGVVIGMSAAQLVFFVLPSLVYVPRLLRRLDRTKVPSV